MNLIIFYMIIINIEVFGSIMYYLCSPYLTLSAPSSPIWLWKTGLCRSWETEYVEATIYGSFLGDKYFRM